MKELGFSDVETIIMPCDEETFWDMRIISASLHKAVTFARAVDWIDEAFARSRWPGRYKSAYSLFHQARVKEAPPEVQEWAQNKADRWGLAVQTIENWLSANQTLAPELQKELTTSSSTERTPSHYITVARELPSRPDLQRPVLEKIEREGLGQGGIREVAKAIRQASDEQEVRTILEQPAGRTADELTRTARVETLLRRPTVEEPARVERRQYENVGLALEVLMDLQQQVHNVRRLRPEILASLSPAQRDELTQAVDDLMGELRQLSDSLRGVIEGRLTQGGG